MISRPIVKSQKELLHVISSTGSNPFGYVLLLGAGASVTSGVKSASTMISEWRSQHFRVFAPAGLSEAEHLEKQTWYQKPNEYAILFETLYELPQQRREYIEKCIEGSSPSWGYIYLASLIASEYFNVVLTTNFDDLISEACAKFRSIPKPIVCAHDSSIESVRLMASRPKIVKLHGDCLFDSLRNTTKETAYLQTNMQQKLAEFAGEYGLIVLGYAGNDNSVMDILKTFMQDEKNFRRGVYWCLLRDDKRTNAKIEDLITIASDRFFLVEIDGFDEFMAELHRDLGVELPPELSKPYETLAEQLNQLLMDATKDTYRAVHPVIADDQSKLRKALEALPPQVVPEKIDFDNLSGFEIKLGPLTVRQAIPYGLFGEACEAAGNTQEALRFLRLQIKHGPNARVFEFVFELLRKHDLVLSLFDEFEALLKLHRRIFEKEYAGGNDLALELMRIGKYDTAKWVLDTAEKAYKQAGDTNPVLGAYFKINRMQIKVHRGGTLSSDEKKKLEAIRRLESPYARMAVHILMEEWPQAEQELQKCLGLGPVGRKGINTWPIIQLLIPHVSKKCRNKLDAAG